MPPHSTIRTKIGLLDADESRAMQQLLAQLKDEPENTATLYQLGCISERLGLHDEAAKFHARVVALEPWNNESKRLLARLRSTGHRDLNHVISQAKAALAFRDDPGARRIWGAAQEELRGSSEKETVGGIQRVHESARGSGSPSILHVYLDFSTWNSARSWSYSAQLALEEGFAANGVQFLSIPAICGLPSRLPASWLSRARELCAGLSFDQVWVELVHSPLDDEFLEWLASIAPVRVGMLPESLESDPAICGMVENLDKRRGVVEGRLRFMTHVLAVDEADAARLNSQGNVKALWWPQAIPGRFVVEELPPPTSVGAIFPGSAYPWRRRWLEDPRLAARCSHQIGPERHTALPSMFDAVNRHAMSRLNQGSACTAEHLGAYVDMIRHIRRKSFKLWLQSLQTGCAVVNLPSVVQGHAGRVVEAMASGRPVISWQIPDRPATSALFRDGEEILTFPADNPDSLMAHIMLLQNEPDTAARIAANARRTIIHHHTMEQRIRQILEWIGSGRQPVYSGAVDTEPDAEVAAFCARFQVPAEAIDCRPSGSPPQSEDDVLRTASEAIAVKDLARAAEILMTAVGEHPDLSGMLGTLHLLMGNLEKAEQHILVALTRSPGDASLMTTAARISLALGNGEAALTYCRQAYAAATTAEQFAEISALVDSIPKGTA